MSVRQGIQPPISNSESILGLIYEICGPSCPLLLQSNSTRFCQSSNLNLVDLIRFLAPVLYRALTMFGIRLGHRLFLKRLWIRLGLRLGMFVIRLVLRLRLIGKRLRLRLRLFGKRLGLRLRLFIKRTKASKPAPFYGVYYQSLFTPATAPTLVNDSRAYLIPGCMVVRLPPTIKT